MQESSDRYLQQIRTSNTERRQFRKVLTVLSLIVVLGVSWTLKLTGITLAGEAFCGMEEHVHGDDCLKPQLICTLEEAEPHVRTEACLLRELVCTEEEREGHSHTPECEARQLLCTEETLEGHTHTEDCRSYTLICELPEQAGHVHGDGCRQTDLICMQEETEGHTHTEDCFQTELSCGMEEDENHTHTDDCLTSLLICELPEVPSHFHESGCWEETLICTEPELEGHSHDESCYRMEEGYTCGIHVHSELCYSDEITYICGLTEEEGHIHGDECWQTGTGFGCGAAEADGHIHTRECATDETELICGLEAAEGHSHTEECYDIAELCPLEEHIHEESCYSDIHADLETSEDWELSLDGVTGNGSTAENVTAVARSQLGITESTLNFQVDENGIRRGITRYGQWYGNPYGDWSAMFVSFCLHYAGAEDLPANADPESMRLEWEQAGLYLPASAYTPRPGNLLFLYKEPQHEEAGADVPGILSEENTEEIIEQVVEEIIEELPPSEPAQVPPANAVAIITGFDDTSITVIEGDLDNAVAETAYSIDDPAIFGYGLVPELSDFAPVTLTQASSVPLALAQADAQPLAQAVSYNEEMFTDTSAFVVYTTSGSKLYAFDGSGNAVPIYLEDGNFYSDTTDPEALLWTFSGSNGTYLIRNVSTGRYMHAYPNNGTGVTTGGAYTSALIPSGNGVRIRSNSEYARLDEAGGKFVMTQSNGAIFQFGHVIRCTVWLDGTCGGLMSLGGSPNTSYAVTAGGTMILPSQWQSPEKYNYTLRGWYDVKNHVYYAPGAEVTVTDNLVFYADWIAATYDVEVVDDGDSGVSAGFTVHSIRILIRKHKVPISWQPMPRSG